MKIADKEFFLIVSFFLKFQMKVIVYASTTYPLTTLRAFYVIQIIFIGLLSFGALAFRFNCSKTCVSVSLFIIINLITQNSFTNVNIAETSRGLVKGPHETQIDLINVLLK